MKNHMFPALRMLLVLTVVTGVMYPVFVTLIAQFAFAHQAEGSLIRRGGIIIGSELIAQKFTNTTYFWPRPSAGDYATVASGASNKGPTSADLKAAAQQRRDTLALLHRLSDKRQIPNDMIFASGSGLDPHISPESARMQLRRVAEARNFNDTQINQLVQIIEKTIEHSQFGFLGQPRVNVLLLNLALDNIK